MLFYDPSNQAWWLGTFNGTALSWTLADDSSGFGNTASDPTWTGDYTGNGKSDVLFYDPSNQAWWLGTFNGTALSWTLADDSSGFGNTASDPTWIGDYTGSSQSDVLFYSPGDQHWWLGTFNGTALSWTLADDSSGFGNTAKDPTWIGDFTGSSQSDVLFYSPGDQHWWLGTFAGTQLGWTLTATT